MKPYEWSGPDKFYLHNIVDIGYHDESYWGLSSCSQSIKPLLRTPSHLPRFFDWAFSYGLEENAVQLRRSYGGGSSPGGF